MNQVSESRSLEMLEQIQKVVKTTVQAALSDRIHATHLAVVEETQGQMSLIEGMLHELEAGELREADLTETVRALKAEMDTQIAGMIAVAYANGQITGSNAEKRKAEADAIVGPTQQDYQQRIQAMTLELAQLQVRNKIGWARLRSFESLLNYRAALVNNLQF